MMKKTAILVMAVAAVNMAAHAGVVAVKLNPVADTYVDNADTSGAFGDASVLRVQSYFDNGLTDLVSIQHTYLKFDLASRIPPDAVIQTAVFGIRVKSIFEGQYGLDEEDPWVDLHYVGNDDWDDKDNQINWVNKPTFNPVAIGSYHNTVETGQHYEWDLLTESGFQWTNYPNDLADGFISLMLKMAPLVENNSNAWGEYYSRENPEELQPYLKITYIIPEPATLSLLGLGMGSLTMFRRKR